MSDPVTLYDPNGNQIQEFGSVVLGMGQSTVWKGTWNVTQEQLDAGKLKFRVDYATYDDDGNRSSASSTAVVSIQKAAPVPKLTASYTVSPTTAQEGQEVTLTYTLSNTGNIAVERVRITNTSVDDKKINIASIGAGEKITKEYTFIMGKKKVTSKPKVTYQAEDSDTVLTIAGMAKKTIDVAKGGLELDLTSDASGTSSSGEIQAKPDDKVELKFTLKNTSNLTYSKIKVEDAKLGVIESDIELKPGETHEIKKDVIVENSTDYKFSVSGSDSTGAEVARDSNVVYVNAMDMSNVLNLDVTADIDKLVIYEEPSVVRFAITVKNIGNVDGEGILLKQGKTTIATIDSLPAGESVTIVKDLQVSMAGTFKFTAVKPGVKATGKTPEQAELTYDSNELKLAYQEPTPLPATPRPETPKPEVTDALEPTVGPSAKDTQGINSIILYALAFLLVLSLIIVLVLILLGRKKQVTQQQSAMVIDSYERNSSRAYMSDGRTRRREERRRMEAEVKVEEEPKAEKKSRRRAKELDVAPPIKEESASARTNDLHPLVNDDAPSDVDMDKTIMYDRSMVEEVRRQSEELEKQIDPSVLSGDTGVYDLSSLRDDKEEEVSHPKRDVRVRRKRDNNQGEDE